MNLDNDDINYLIGRLEDVLLLMKISKHQAAAAQLSVISLLKGSKNTKTDETSAEVSKNK